jgi:hypothetical protein
MPNVTIGPYNNIAITAVSGVYRLKSVQLRTVDIMNLGTGAVFIRSDSDPAVNDANSLQLPANFAANGLNVDPATGLGIIAVADTTIAVRAR